MVRIDYPVENPMVSGFGFPEQGESKVIAECQGCFCGIEEGESYLDFNDELLHDDPFCCQEYMDRIAVKRTAVSLTKEGGEQLG